VSRLTPYAASRKIFWGAAPCRFSRTSVIWFASATAGAALDLGRRALLGINAGPLLAGGAFRGPGVLVEHVVAGSAAAKAAVITGDVVVSVDGARQRHSRAASYRPADYAHGQARRRPVRTAPGMVFCVIKGIVDAESADTADSAAAGSPPSAGASGLVMVVRRSPVGVTAADW
jgi:hypothetical protein